LANPLNIFALLYDGTTKKLMQYFKDNNNNWTNKEIQPDDGATLGSITRISKDLKGRIWCGNKRWDGASWFYPDTQNTITNAIDYTIVGGEGMAYLRTTGGQLWVWGKTPTPYYPTR
jgi:ribosomal protein L2